MKAPTAIFAALFYLCLICFDVKAQQNEPTGIEYDIPNLVTTTDLISLPGYKIEIYKGQKANIFYINPFLLPDWDDYKSQLDSIQAQDRSDDKNHVLSLQISFINNQIESEVRGILINENLATSPNPSINFFPFTYYLLFAQFSDEDGKLYTVSINPEANQHIGETMKPSLSIPPYIGKITGNFKMLNALYNSRRISNTINGKSFSSGYIYSSDNLTAFSKTLSNQNIIQDIQGTESMKMNTVVTNGSSSAGVGLSLGPVSLGGTDQNSTTNTEINNSRYVNRNYIANAIQSHKTEIDIFAQGTPDFLSKSIAIVVDMFTKNMQTVNVRFDKINDGEYEATIENAGRYDITGDQAKILLSAKPSADVNVDNENSGSYGGATGKNVQKGDIKTANDISWTFDGKNYIPTSGTLYVASNTNLQDELSVKMGTFTKGGTVGMAVDMIYPNVIYGTGVQARADELFGFPIGTIVAFGGDIAKTPAGWKFCDGKALSVHDNGALFDAIGYYWGKMPNGDFNVPDLRGAFLRGADNGRGWDLDRISAGHNAITGDFQNDAFQSHWHSIQPNVGGGCCNAFAQVFSQNPAAPVAGTIADIATTIIRDRNYPNSIDPKLSNETRPKNYTVNYIIRWK